MNGWQQIIDVEWLTYWEVLIDDWFIVAAGALFLAELVRYAFKKTLSWRLIGDSVTNIVTLFMFIGVNLLIATAYIAAFYWAYQYRIFDLPVTPVMIVLCLLAADFAYYWEHRFAHRVAIGWATHTVHHSSPYFNLSVAYRFGPLDGVLPILFHLPLAVLGFHPILIFFCEKMVQIFQTLLHTEAVRRLPAPIEWIFNTPSHHRVHHGSNPQYMDKNYAGILIVWDRLFGTFEREEEPVVFGVTEPINSINPLTVFFHGFGRLGRELGKARSPGDILGYLFRPPGWQPRRLRNRGELAES